MTVGGAEVVRLDALAVDLRLQVVHVDGAEDVAAGAVGQAGPLPQRDEAIVGARGDYFESVMQQESAKPRLDVEGDVFFGDVDRGRARVAAAVAGVEDDAVHSQREGGCADADQGLRGLGAWCSGRLRP